MNRPYVSPEYRAYLAAAFDEWREMRAIAAIGGPRPVGSLLDQRGSFVKYGVRKGA